MQSICFFYRHVLYPVITIQQYESGKYLPKHNNLIKLATALKCEISDIDERINASTSYLTEQENTSQTYADVIELLVNTENALKFKLDLQHTNRITIHDRVVQCFLDDWVKILPLLRDGTVDDELYKLWIDNKKKEYGKVHIGNEKEVEEFLLLMEVIGSPILSKTAPDPDDTPQD